MKMNMKFEYLAPESEVIEMLLEGSVLIESDPIGGGEDGEMEEGGEI